MSFKRSLVSLGFLAMALAAPAARAQSCKVAADCSKGFFCELLPNAPPTIEPVSSPPACKEGTICPVADPSPTSGVAADVAIPAAVTGICQEASCTSDASCGTGMVCHTDTIQTCSGGTSPACPANADCIAAKPSAPTCTDTKVSKCMYKWQLPCNVDNDCGAGFDCKPTVSGWCSGSGGTPAAGAGTSTPTKTAPATGGATGSNTASGAAVAPVPPDTNCGTSTTFPGYCQPKATTCAVDTDCPASWTCVEGSTRVAEPGTAVSGPTTSATDVATAPSPTTTTGAAAPTPTPVVPTAKMCTSPLGVYATGNGGTTTTGSGNPGTTTTGAGGSTGTVDPKMPQAGGAHDTTESAAPSAGCAVGGSASGSPFALMLLGALGLVLARRRR